MKHLIRGFLLLSVCVLLPAGYAASQKTNVDSLIEKGKLLVEQGTYDAGIAVLETVLAKDPKNVKALNALLPAYDAYAKKLSSEGRLSQAQTMLQKSQGVLETLDSIPDAEFSADELKSNSRIKRETAEAKLFLKSQRSTNENAASVVALNSARQKYNEAVAHFKKREYEIAQALLDESIELDPKNPYAHELLGDIANLNHDLDAAERHYREAFSLGSDQILKGKLEKLFQEKKVDRTQQEYSDEHFIIRYRRSENFEGSQIRQFLREAYRDISQELGFYPRYKIPVTLYNRSEYETLMGSVPHWSGALYDGKIRLPVYEGSATASELKKLIFHELAHAFVSDLSQMRCPVWLNEGIAQYQENKIIPIPDFLGQVIQEGHFLEPEGLLTYDLASEKNQAKAAAFYLESFSIVSELLARYRWYHLKQFLSELGKGTEFKQGFEKVFGRSFSDFGAEWKIKLYRRYGKK